MEAVEIEETEDISADENDGERDVDQDEGLGGEAEGASPATPGARNATKASRGRAQKRRRGKARRSARRR